MLREIMSKITQGSTDREETPKPRRKRRRRDLDRIHSKILQAKRKLVGRVLDSTLDLLGLGLRDAADLKDEFEDTRMLGLRTRFGAIAPRD